MNKKKKAKKKHGQAIRDVLPEDASKEAAPLADIARKGKESRDSRSGIHVEVPVAFRRAYKLYAFERDMTLLQLFEESFELYKKIHS